MGLPEPMLHASFKRLQLPFFAEHHANLLAQAGRESWPHGRRLETLVTGEVERRNAALIERRVKAARLPGIKTLEAFDRSWPKKINRAQVRHLFRLDFLPAHGNGILLGGVGVGKTHLAIALAHTACLQGRTTFFCPRGGYRQYARRRPGDRRYQARDGASAQAFAARRRRIWVSAHR